MRTSEARDWFARMPSSIVPRYRAYWRRLAPSTNDDVFRRWLFAFCSVHTSWQGNVRGYKSIRDFRSWLGDRADLVGRLLTSRTGMHNMKANFIHAFATRFWSRPEAFSGTTTAERDAVVESVSGLGLAKASFAMNMVRPLDSQVVCMDVHMLRLYGMENLDYKTPSGLRAYRRAEYDWVSRCEDAGVAPYIAHSMYWDRLHGQVRPGYWADCLI